MSADEKHQFPTLTVETEGFDELNDAARAYADELAELLKRTPLVGVAKLRAKPGGRVELCFVVPRPGDEPMDVAMEARFPNGAPQTSAPGFLRDCINFLMMALFPCPEDDEEEYEDDEEPFDESALHDNDGNLLYDDDGIHVEDMDPRDYK